MSTQQWSLGIDFGTSNTAAAHTNPVKGGVEAINLSHNQTTMPSSVYVADADTIEVGEVAFDRALDNPAGFIPSPKRLIPQHTFQVNGLDVPSSQPVAAVLSSVMDRAVREHGGTPPQKLVLTHPEAWSEEDINVLLEAAGSLGLSGDSVSTVSEPQAAAHYYSKAQVLSPGEKIAVFDFGGGTLDVAVLQAEDNGTFSVVAAGGDPNLGGKNFDALVRRWVDAQLEDEDPELLAYLRKKAPISERHALDDSIRRAKELLSEASSATIAFTVAGENHRIQLSRTEFEEIIAPQLEKAVSLTQRTLKQAGVTSADGIKALYLTGGSSRIPAVQEVLKDIGPVATLDNPKTVVAQGALSAVAPLITNVAPVLPPTIQASATQSAPSTPSTSSTSSTPSTTHSSKEGSSKKWALIATAAAVVVAIPVIVMAVRGGNSSDEASPAADTASDSAVAETTADSAASPQDAALNALPQELRDQLEECRYDRTTRGSEGSICRIKDQGDNANFFVLDQQYVVPQLGSYLDSTEARSRRAAIRDGLPDQVEVRFSNDSPRAAAVTKSYASNDSFDLLYTDADTGLIIHGSKLTSPENAFAYLEKFGLL